MFRPFFFAAFSKPMRIQRHKTAIGRTELSRPFQLALASGVIKEGTEVLDYGCGRGDDIRVLSALGFACEGWDPVHRPDGNREASDVVNLGYVVNVIEDPEERADALVQAWALAKKALVVAGRVDIQSQPEDADALGDGILTSRGTFQKFFTQDELRAWIEKVLKVDPIAAGPGIFFVFRSDLDRQRYSSGILRRAVPTRVSLLDNERIAEHRKSLEPLLGFFEERGRLPSADELPNASEVISVFGSIPKSFRAVRSLMGEGVWQEIAEARKEDLLVHLALERFRGRPRYSELPPELQVDVKSFSGAYTVACEQADALLFSAGRADLISAACKESPVGKLTPEALYVHRSALSRVPALLRVFEGCARVVVGDVDAELIKLDRGRAKISYLSYPEFDEVAHPPLQRSIVVWLDTMRAKLYDFSGRSNPPILHRKETFVGEDYPRRDLFARLTRQEEKRGLLDNATIGTQEGWEALLADRGFKVAGHVLRRSV